MECTLVQTWLSLVLITFCSIPSNGQIRADLQKGFKLCPGKQWGRIVSVKIESPGCYNRNGQTQWPCFAYPGNKATLKIKFKHNVPEPMTNIKSSIYVITKFRGFFGLAGEQRMPAEVKKDACKFMGCPLKPRVAHSIQKTGIIPDIVRLLHRNIKLEYKLTDKNGNTIICFIFPVINP